MSIKAWQVFKEAASIREQHLECMDYLVTEYPEYKFEISELAELLASCLLGLHKYNETLEIVDSQLQKFKGGVGLQLIKVEVLILMKNEQAYHEMANLFMISDFTQFEMHHVGLLCEGLRKLCCSCYRTKRYRVNRSMCGESLLGLAKLLFEMLDKAVITSKICEDALLKCLRMAVSIFTADDLRSYKNIVQTDLRSRGLDADIGFWSLCKPKHLAMQTKPRVAILLSGQMRGYSKNVQYISQFNDYDIDIFVATWERSGFRRPTIERGTCIQLNRMFSAKAVGLFMDKPQITSDFFENESSLTKVLSEPLAEAALKDRYAQTGALTINVFIGEENEFLEKHQSLIAEMWDRHPFYTAHSTPENSLRMVFLNQAVMDLVDDVSYYDFIIRMRPDGYMPDLESIYYAVSRITHGDYQVIVDNGGGFGDQLAVGTPHAMSTYCSLWERLLEGNFDMSGAIGYGTQPHLRLIDYFIEQEVNAVADNSLLLLHDDSVRISDAELCSILRWELEGRKHSEDVNKWISNILIKLR